MIGTEKQIAWAEQIKTDMIIKLAELKAAILSEADEDDQMEIDAALAAIEKAAENEKASFWIDNRNNVVGIVKTTINHMFIGSESRPAWKPHNVMYIVNSAA